MGRDNLTKILGEQFKRVMYRNIERWAFERNKTFSKLTKIQIEKAIDSMKVTDLEAGEVVFPKGTVCGKKIVVVIEGAVKKVIIQKIFSHKIGTIWHYPSQ